MAYVEYKDGRRHSPLYPNGSVPDMPVKSLKTEPPAVSLLQNKAAEMESLYSHFRDWTAVLAFLNID